MDPPARRTTLGRGVLIATILVSGPSAWLSASRKSRPAFNRLVIDPGRRPTIKSEIRAGSARNPLDPCKPSAIRTTFSTADDVYIGGYFSKVVPRGETATVYVYVDGVLSASQPLSSATQMVGCYYELDPLVGAPAGSYRLVVSYLGETIAEGDSVIR